MPTPADDLPIILVADDDDMARFIIERFIVRLGFLALITENGSAAVALVQTKKPKICLAILDYDMPGLDGIETFLALRKLCSGLKAILHSGHPDIDYLRGKCLDGLVCHPKDNNHFKLKDLIYQLLNKP